MNTNPENAAQNIHSMSGFSNKSSSRPLRVAVVGAGVSGCAAAWLLHRAGIDVHLYDKEKELGGHAHTLQGEDWGPVDSGFLVYNENGYPNLASLFRFLEIETDTTQPSFSVSIDSGRLEYASDKLFAQKSNLFSPRFYLMLLEILRFYNSVPDLLKNVDLSETLSLGDFLEREKFSRAFRERHLYPVASAIWSMGAGDAAHFPLRHFLNFFATHGFLDGAGLPAWRTVRGGSRNYLRKMMAPLIEAGRFYGASPVRAVDRREDGVELQIADGQVVPFDHVVMATHADITLALLNAPDSDERTALSAFPYTWNVAYLHKDPALMPRRKAAWAGWNYMAEREGGHSCITYWLSKMQSSPEGGAANLFETLNPPVPPDPSLTLKKLVFHHPRFGLQAYQGWSHISRIQGRRRTWYCGAWCGRGFHEDGLTSGLTVAETLGSTRRPWNVTETSPAARRCSPESG